MMSRSDPSLPAHDLMIVGGGFAACSALAWLARLSPQKLRVAVMVGLPNKADPARFQHGQGLAYGDQDPAHLLNAAHWNMGVLDSEPDAYSHWLRKVHADTALPVFGARADYGAFLCDQWRSSLAALSQKGSVITLIEHQAMRLSLITKKQVSVFDDTGTEHVCARLLICEGPTQLRQENDGHPRWITPIWPSGLQRLKGASGHVVIIGTGLSAIDAAISALAEQGVTKVTMISRDGRLPLAHDVKAQSAIPQLDFYGSPRAVLRAVRAAATKPPWQAIMNALRSQSNQVWQAWTLNQRRAALRHLNELWAVHRNRLPPETLAQITQARASGRLSVVKDNVSVVHDPNRGLCVKLDSMGTLLWSEWIIDARGFVRVSSETDSLCGRALREGHFTVSPLGYGVTADGTHRATPINLAPVHVVGAARMGDLIETTGAPEVRTQVRQSLEALFG